MAEAVSLVLEEGTGEGGGTGCRLSLWETY